MYFFYSNTCAARPSETHAHSPRVVCEDFLSFLHDAGVCALVDGVGHYGDVVVFQGDVVGVRELQQLAVLVPAATKRESRVRRAPPHPPTIAALNGGRQHIAEILTTLCLSLTQFSSRSGK